MIDSPSISQGIGRGEAVVLGQSSFDPVEQSRLLNLQAQQQIAEKNRQKLKNQALLSNDIKAQWDTDVFNYFKPKADALKQEIMERIKQTNGNLSMEDEYRFNAAFDNLEQEALVSNAVYKAYSDQVKMLDSDKSDVYDREESRRNLELFKNPMLSPETKREVEELYGGDIMKWRADNAERYGLVRSYDREGFITDISKGLKPQGVYVKNSKGEPEVFKNEAGGYYTKLQTGVTDDQLSTKVNSIWTGTTRNDKKTREADINTVQSMFMLDEFGRPVPVIPDDPTTQMVLKNAKLKGKVTEDEIWKELGKAYTFTDLRKRYPISERIQTASRAPQGRSSSGGGSSFDETYQKAESKYKYGDVNLAVTMPGQNWVINASEKGSEVRRIALERKNKSGSDTESIQIGVSGKPVRPIAFYIDDNTGEVMFEFSENKQVGVDPVSGKPVFRWVNSSKVVGQDIEANIAAHYGFSNYEDFKKQVLGYKGKGKKPASKPQVSVKQEALSPTKPTKTFKGVPKGGF